MTKSAMSKVKPFRCEKLYFYQIEWGMQNHCWAELSSNVNDGDLEISTLPFKDTEKLIAHCESIAASFGAELVDMREKK